MLEKIQNIVIVKITLDNLRNSCLDFCSEYQELFALKTILNQFFQLTKSPRGKLRGIANCW